MDNLPFLITMFFGRGEAELIYWFDLKLDEVYEYLKDRDPQQYDKLDREKVLSVGFPYNPQAKPILNAQSLELIEKTAQDQGCFTTAGRVAGGGNFKEYVLKVISDLPVYLDQVRDFYAPADGQVIKVDIVRQIAVLTKIAGLYLAKEERDALAPPEGSKLVDTGESVLTDMSGLLNRCYSAIEGPGGGELVEKLLRDIAAMSNRIETARLALDSGKAETTDNDSNGG